MYMFVYKLYLWRVLCFSALLSYIFAGVAFGDPHVGTIDGFSYSFNGLGDYYLVTSSHSSEAGVQSRTCKAFTTIPPSRATVFCGFAVYEKDQPTVEIHKNTTSILITLDKLNGIKHCIFCKTG